MKCNRCGNENQEYFYKDKEIWYCRKCIAFGRLDVGKDPPHITYKKQVYDINYKLEYPLTSAQRKVVKEIEVLQNQGHDVLIYAACGAGKTELVMDSIMRFLKKGKKVGFAISRRQVVLEIRDRLAQAFSPLQVIAVCEGYTDIIDGDIIVCTMHQLYRYEKTFDLLIMDEVDAFPYRGNEMLEKIAMRSCIGQKLYLTATPDDEMLEKVKRKELCMVELFMRPHGYPLIVPEIIHRLPWLQYSYLINYLYEHKKKNIQVLLFVPTIKMAHHFYHILRLCFRCTTFTSKTKDKEKVIEDFHSLKYDFLISTTILERGITIRGIHIAILHADHPVFNEASLIQMIGRVGRRLEMPTGKGVFLCTHVTKDIKRCVNAIEHMNTTLPNRPMKTVKLIKEPI